MSRQLKISCELLILAIVLACGNAFAQTAEIDSRKKKMEKIEKDISYLDNQIKAVQQKKSNTLEELVLIQRKIENRKNLLAELDTEIKEHNRAILLAQNEISQLEQRLDTLEHYYQKMVYNAYKHRDTKVWFMYILASENLEQGYRRWSYLKNYSKAINEQSAKIRELKQEHGEKIRKVQKLKGEALAAQANRTKEYNTLTKEEQQSKQYAASLDKQHSTYKKQLAQKKKEAERLDKEVERLIAAEIKRQQEIARRQAELAKKQAQKETENNTANSVATTVSVKEFQEFAAAEKLGGSFALNRGKLPYPVSSGVIIEKFGEHPHPTLKNVKLPFNNGINISTKPGSNVSAVFDGVVKQVIAIPGYNQCVLVQHGKYFTFYCKLAEVEVKVGDNIAIGTVLGSLEKQGSTATLHFELWNGTTKQNPELWLKK